jgi:hypothetical protein
LIIQAEVIDAIWDLELPKTKAELLGSRFQQWNLLKKGVKMSFYRKRQSDIAKYFSMEGELVSCNVICGLMEELQLQHGSEQRDSSSIHLR